MKKRILLVALVLAVAVVATFAQEKTAQTMDEALQVKIHQAEIDRKKLSVYAVSSERLNSGRKIKGLPEELRKAALAGYSYAKSGESEVRISRRGDVVTFTVSPSVSAMTAFDGLYSRWQEDPIETLIGWVREGRLLGIVFIKDGDSSMFVAIPSWQIAAGMTRDGYSPALRQLCQKFGLGGEPRDFKTDAEIKAEGQFLSWLMLQYGERNWLTKKCQGVLTRKKLEKELGNELAIVDKIAQDSQELAGYIVYDPTVPNSYRLAAAQYQ